MAFPGGILADSRDRKKIMVTLDVVGAIVAFGFLAIDHSVALLYFLTVCQSTVAGMYEPSRSAILPQLVESEYLEKANEVCAIVWSLTTAVATSFGGFIVARYGVSACFALDSVFFLVSALVLAMFVKGDYKVVPASDPAGEESADRIYQSTSRDMMSELFAYLWSSDVGAYVCIKGSAALLFGASDVLDVSFSEVDGVLDSQRLGWMFAGKGIGCLVGPILVPEGRSYIFWCILSYGILGAGYGLIGLSNQYWMKCLFNVFRAAGTAILWVDSEILIQTTSPPALLGRVSSIDFGLANLGEATSAVFAGLLQDHGLSADQVALILGCTSCVFAVLWSVWNVRRRRKANAESPDSIEMEPLR
jgi:MFS family permease